MWCHLCKTDYKNYEDFKVHILKVHRCASEFYRDSSDSEESKEENVEASEIDENDAFSDQDAVKFSSDAGSEDFSPKSDTSHSSKVHARKKRYALRKRTHSRHKKSFTSYQEDSSEHSDDNMSNYSKSSTKKNEEQTIANSQPVLNNNQVYFINPYVGQGTNNFAMGNQAVQQPMYVFNPFVTKSSQSDGGNSFDFSSKNILKWLSKHKELCRTIKFPLPPSLFNQIKTVHKGIFDRYCMASSDEETTAVMKVYEELNNMIHRHISQINDNL